MAETVNLQKYLEQFGIGVEEIHQEWPNNTRAQIHESLKENSLSDENVLSLLDFAVRVMQKKLGGAQQSFRQFEALMKTEKKALEASDTTPVIHEFVPQPPTTRKQYAVVSAQTSFVSGELRRAERQAAAQRDLETVRALNEANRTNRQGKQHD